MQPIKKIFVAILSLSLLSTTIPLTPKALADVIVTNVIVQTFAYDLQVGSEGQDVYNLQRFLNASEDTAIAFSGTGSRGYESTTFGNLTKAAVIKFQNKYGIKPADGYVGISTREKINELYPTTNFNAPYPQKVAVTTTNTGETNNTNTGGINLCQFVDLLIAIDVIKPEKADQAKSLLTGCTSASINVATNNNTNATSSYWSSLPKPINTTTATLDELNNYYNNLGNSYGNYVDSTLNLYQDMSSTIFTGGKSLSDVRRFAVFAGGSLTNTNKEGVIMAVASTSVATSTSVSSSTIRTYIIGDVGALTEQAVPLKIEGKNEFNLGTRTQPLSALNKAIELSDKLPCDYSFTASSTDIGGRTLGPGKYCFTGDIVVSSPITLSNPASTTNPTASTTGLYIFKTTKSLTTKNLSTNTSTTSTSTVKLAGPNSVFDERTGLPPYSVFWVTDGNVNIAENTIFLGTVMTKTGYINVGENTEIPEGRVLTRTAISLNKNLIKTPPDPVKITVNLDGDSSGSVSGPGGFFCSTDKKSTSPRATSSLNKKGVTCQHYYALGEVVTLKASPVSSQTPFWRGGCENGKSGMVSNNTCVITIKKDTDLAVNFFLDTFGGLSIPYPPFWIMKLPCITTPGFLFTVVGTQPGIFVVPLNKTIDGLEGWIPMAPVIGTLQDGKSTSCILPTGKSAGPFRLVEDMRFSTKAVGL